jgi:hypothetical protein
VIGRPHQTASGEAARGRPLDHCEHQLSPDRLILYCRVDGDGADPGDRIAFVKKVTADNCAVQFRDGAVKAGCASIAPTTAVAISTEGKSQGKLCSLEIDLKASRSIRPSAAASSREPDRNFMFTALSSAYRANSRRPIENPITSFGVGAFVHRIVAIASKYVRPLLSQITPSQPSVMICPLRLLFLKSSDR